MKKIISLILGFFVIFVSCIPMTCFCADETESVSSEIYDELDELLDDYDIDWSVKDLNNMSFADIMRSLAGSVAEKMQAPLKLLMILITVILFSAVTNGIGDGMLRNSGNSGLYSMVCTITAASVMTQPLFTIYENTLSALEKTGGFMMVFVPVFSGVTIACGGTLTGGTYSMLIIGASELFIAAAENYLMPILSVTAALAVTGSVFESTASESIVRIIKKVVTWGLTVSMTLFTGFSGIKCTLAAKADGAATKTVKYVMSGFIPIVGGAVSDAYSTVRGSFELIRSTVGIAGNIAIILFLLPPLTDIIIFRGVIKLGSAAAEIFSVEAPAKLLKGIDDGLAIAQSVLICYSVMLIICTGILVQTFG